MTRVTKGRVRQAILVDNEPIDPFNPPEYLQLLREDGSIVDPTKDNTKLGWRGTYDPLLTYNINDMVQHEGYFWVAPTTMLPGNIPGAVAPEPSMTTTKAGNAMFGGTDRDAYLVEADVPITDEYLPLLPHDPIFFAGGSYVRVNAGLGDEVTFEWEGGSIYLMDGQHGDQLFPGDDPLNRDSAIPDTESPLTFTVPDVDLGGGLGVSHLTVELAPTVTSFTWVVTGEAPAVWEAISADPVELPPGGDPGDRLVKVTADDFDVEWAPASEVFPPGGAEGALLAKATVADGDVEWISAASILPPDELPPGGAAGYILAKASVTDGDVEWVEAPSGGSGLPAGGTMDQVLVKQSSTDGDADWETLVGSSTPDYILLDDRFDSDPLANYTVDGALSDGTLAYSTTTDGDGTVRGFLYVTAFSKTVFFDRTSLMADDVRDVLVAVEVEWSPSMAGTPVFAFDLRRQSDRNLKIQSHGTNIHIYSTVSGSDSLRANSATTYSGRGWIVGMVYQDFITCWWSQNHPLSKFFGQSQPTGSNGVTFSLSADSNFNTEARRDGTACRLRMSTGSSGGTTNQWRLLRHLIVDLGKLPVI